MLGRKSHQQIEADIEILHYSVPVDRFDYGWDPYEREEAVWRGPTSRSQIYIGERTAIVPLDEQEILTDWEEDTADPHYVPGKPSKVLFFVLSWCYVCISRIHLQ